MIVALVKVTAIRRVVRSSIVLVFTIVFSCLTFGFSFSVHNPIEFLRNNNNYCVKLMHLDSRNCGNKQFSHYLRMVEPKSNLHIENEDDDDEEEDNEEQENEEDPYAIMAASEFEQISEDSLTLSSALLSNSSLSTKIDWGGALGTLRKRVDDIEQGKAGNPSQVLFRLLSAQSPNQMIGSFVTSANPQIVQAMSGAVDSLLGGLSNPASGIETIVKASGDKIGSLCFQLQMTGYMFRNAEYVIALKKIMQLRGSASLQEYKEAFDRLDVDNSGYIETGEVETLLDSVYKDKSVPDFEVSAFMKFFDTNKDGRISWDEFERGLGTVFVDRVQFRKNLNILTGSSDEDEDEDDDEEITNDFDVELSGTIEIELDTGKVVKVDANEYMNSLKQQAKILKDTLRKQKEISPVGKIMTNSGPSDDEYGSITTYIASRQGDVKSLTEGISSEIVETMKMLVDYVLEGGENAKSKNVRKEEIELEIPGSALQQLALWQLILGYRLRESEAKGDYLKLLQ